MIKKWLKSKIFEKWEMRKDNLNTFFLLPIFLLVLGSTPNYAEKIDVSFEIKNLRSKDINKKLNAINKLAKVKDKKVTDELIKTMKLEKNPHTKVRIIETLSSKQDKAISKELESLLKTDPSAEVRFSAAYSLGYAKDESVVPSLISTFLNKDEKLGVRLQSANALTYYPATEEIYQGFMKGLEDKNPQIRAQSITSLSLSFAVLKEKEVVEVLKQALQDENALVRKVARERLEFLGVKLK